MAGRQRGWETEAHSWGRRASSWLSGGATPTPVLPGLLLESVVSWRQAQSVEKRGQFPFRYTSGPCRGPEGTLLGMTVKLIIPMKVIILPGSSTENLRQRGLICPFILP